MIAQLAVGTRAVSLTPDRPEEFTGWAMPGGYDLAGNGFTPNISMAYDLIDSISGDAIAGVKPLIQWNWFSGYYDVAMASSIRTGDLGQMTLTPDTGWLVALNSVDVVARGTEQTNQTVRVLDASDTVLWELTGGTIPITGLHLTLDVASAGPIRFQFGDGDIAIDNVDFDQRVPVPVPEPATGLLVLCGAVAAFVPRKRHWDRRSRGPEN